MYDTSEMISIQDSADFISNEERLTRMGIDNVTNIDAIGKPTRMLKKRMKN